IDTAFEGKFTGIDKLQLDFNSDGGFGVRCEPHNSHVRYPETTSFERFGILDWASAVSKVRSGFAVRCRCRTARRLENFGENCGVLNFPCVAADCDQRQLQETQNPGTLWGAVPGQLRDVCRVVPCIEEADW
ncbi:MAG TPA: hypothetical protein DCX79_05235, partial [Planctomycetaceae bacterium]|nr:hypothetical protein [Planctomycetaceae bacterium]